MKTEFSIEQIDEVVRQFLNQKPKRVILFNGNMGVGKTTFIKALSKALGVQDTTSSPTFSLVNEYRTNGDEPVYHFDVYRLNSESEALDMGIDEYLYSGAWCFIEWAEKIPNLIPEGYSVVDLELLPNGNRMLILRS